MTAEKLELVGFGDVEESIRDRVREIATTAVDRLGHHFSEYSLSLHLKGLHTVGNTPKGKPPKEKYELHVHFRTPEKVFTASDVEWDLVKLTHSTLQSVQREIEHVTKR